MASFAIFKAILLCHALIGRPKEEPMTKRTIMVFKIQIQNGEKLKCNFVYNLVYLYFKKGTHDVGVNYGLIYESNKHVMKVDCHWLSPLIA